jgi:hypothetical protein
MAKPQIPESLAPDLLERLRPLPALAAHQRPGLR